MTTLEKLPKNVEDLGKLIVAKGLKKWHKVQKIAQSGHTGYHTTSADKGSSLLGFKSFYYFYQNSVVNTQKVIYTQSKQQSD